MQTERRTNGCQKSIGTYRHWFPLFAPHPGRRELSDVARDAERADRASSSYVNLTDRNPSAEPFEGNRVRASESGPAHPRPFVRAVGRGDGQRSIRVASQHERGSIVTRRLGPLDVTRGGDCDRRANGGGSPAPSCATVGLGHPKRHVTAWLLPRERPFRPRPHRPARVRRLHRLLVVHVAGQEDHGRQRGGRAGYPTFPGKPRLYSSRSRRPNFDRSRPGDQSIKGHQSEHGPENVMHVDVFCFGGI